MWPIVMAKYETKGLAGRLVWPRGGGGVKENPPSKRGKSENNNRS